MLALARVNSTVMSPSYYFMKHNFRLVIFLHGVIVAASVAVILELRLTRFLALVVLAGTSAATTFLFARTMSHGIATPALSALTTIVSLAIATVVYMFVIPTRSEGESYIFGAAIFLLITVVMFFLPLTVAGWIFRFRSNRYSKRAT